MKFAIAVLGLLALSAGAQASQQKLPLAGLLVNKDVNVTLTDLLPQVNVTDLLSLIHSLPKFQLPVANISGLHATHNLSDIQIPLVSLKGIHSAVKEQIKEALTLGAILGKDILGNHTVGLQKNFSMPSLPSVNVSSMAVPLHALLGAGMAVKGLPLSHLLALVNATHSIQVPKLSLPTLNVSDVGVPLSALVGLKFKGLPLLAHLAGNASLSLPVINITKPSFMHGNATVGAIPLPALLGLKGAFLSMFHGNDTKIALPDILSLLHANKSDINLLAGLTKSFNMSDLPLGSLAALHKAFNVSGLPLSALVDGKLGALAALLGGMGNGTIAAGPSIGINVVPGSIGMKNIGLNLTHPTLGLKPLALALNLTHPELAMRLASLNFSLPVPTVGMGSSALNLTLPIPELSAAMGNLSVTVPTASVSMPSVSVDKNGTGNGTTVSLTKPGLSFGNATITLPTITPQLALKLAQLGINVPTPQLGLKKATIGATLPMPDVQLAQRAINLTLPVPDIGMKQFGLNLTVPDIQLPRLELNVSGMPQLGLNLDGLKSATLLSWLKDAGFYSLGNATEGNATVINLAHPKGL